MSSESQSAPDSAKESPKAIPAKAPLSPAVKQRLEQLFAHAKRGFEKGDHDYAHDLLTQCVAEDPSSLVYAQHFRANLVGKWGNDIKKSSRFQALRGGGRSTVAKHAGKGEWQQAFTAGCNSLKKNPADVDVIRELAAACGLLGQIEVQLFWLRWGLDLNLTDYETNRQAAGVLASMGEYDQAISCWQRVLQTKPNDEEAHKAVSHLSVEKTISKGGYDPAMLRGEEGKIDLPATRVSDLSRGVREAPPIEIDEAGNTIAGNTVSTAPAEETPEAYEQRLLDAIDQQPAEMTAYMLLAEFYTKEGRLQDAERVLTRALSTTASSPEGENLAIRELLEDAHLKRIREQFDAAQARWAKDASETAKESVARAQQQLNKSELQIYRARAERTPGDPRSQFEYGLRLKRVGDYRKAITAFQAARGDKKRESETQLHLGECFQQIEQFRLASTSYEAAVAAADWDSEELRKLALYRAGALAMGLKDLDRAEQRLTDLAAIDFGYRDVAERLDKIARLRKDT